MATGTLPADVTVIDGMWVRILTHNPDEEKPRSWVILDWCPKMHGLPEGVFSLIVGEHIFGGQYFSSQEVADYIALTGQNCHDIFVFESMQMM